MTTEKAVQFVNTLTETAMADIISRRFFVLLFEDKAGEIHAYDTRYPANCLRSVVEKNIDFEFVYAIAETSESSVREICKIMRTARSIREKVHAAAAAAAASPTAH